MGLEITKISNDYSCCGPYNRYLYLMCLRKYILSEKKYYFKHSRKLKNIFFGRNCDRLTKEFDCLWFGQFFDRSVIYRSFLRDITSCRDWTVENSQKQERPNPRISCRSNLRSSFLPERRLHLFWPLVDQER